MVNFIMISVAAMMLAIIMAVPVVLMLAERRQSSRQGRQDAEGA